MTVGIGLICEGGTAAVVASDRLTTMENIGTEHESAPKLVGLSDRAVVMGSGGYSEMVAVLDGLTDQERTDEPTCKLADCILRERTRVRKHFIDGITRKYVGMDMAQFATIPSPGQNALTQTAYNEVLKGFAMTFLLAGIDSDRTAHLFTINDLPATPENFDMAGLTTVGSGSIHAYISLVHSGFHKALSLEETVFQAYAAKRVAEFAIGVGKRTDIAIVSADAPSRFLEEAAIKELGELYRKKMKRMRLSKKEQADLAEDISRANS